MRREGALIVSTAACSGVTGGRSGRRSSGKPEPELERGLRARAQRVATQHVAELGTANGELWAQMEAEMMVGGKV